MPLGVPGIFPPSKEFVANFDWIDLASATGHIEYCGLNAKDSVADNYSLIQSDNKGAVSAGNLTTNEVKSTNITGNSGQSFDKDFDLTVFQLPRTLEGDAFARVSMGSRGDAITNVVITAKLRKWDGSTETDIVSVDSDTFTITAGDETSRTLKLAVPKTHFKKGETLRLTIQITTSNNFLYQVGHDPQDKSSSNLAAGNTKLGLIVPYRLDFL